MGMKTRRKMMAALAAVLGLAASLVGCQGPVGLVMPPTSYSSSDQDPQNPQGPATPQTPSANTANANTASSNQARPTFRGQSPGNYPITQTTSYGPRVNGSDSPGYPTVGVTGFGASGYSAPAYGSPAYSTPISYGSGVQQASPRMSGVAVAGFQNGGQMEDDSGSLEGAPSPRMVPMPANGAMMNGQTGQIMDGGPPGVLPCPRELTPVSLPPYTIAPPDILYLDALRLVPKPPYRIEPLEVLLLNVTDTLPNQPIQGPFIVSPEGMINLGYNYGSVRVGGLTLEDAQGMIRTHLSKILRNPQVTLALAQFRGLQQVRGQHLIRPDGTISLGVYGAVYVAGLTLGQAKCVIEKHLSQYLLEPQVAIDVLAYNSKVYFVIFDGGGFGQQVFRLPITGNETVLDAISLVQGIAPVSSKRRIWLARPAPANMGCSQILPVDWNAITQAGQTATNYQVFPGDRIYVSAKRIIAFDNYLSMVLNPINRIMGTTLLTTAAVNGVRSLSVPITNNTGGFVPFIGR